MSKFGIGLTTFRDKKSENMSIPVYMKMKRGKKFEAAKKVNQVVRESIDWSIVSEYKGYPALGTYEGGQEPAAHLYVSTRNRTTLKMNLEAFRTFANQDSILLYEFVKSKGAPVLEINIGHGHDTQEIQQIISRSTDGKVGGYLTYIYSLHRLVIVNVKEFDGLTPSQFRKHIPAIKRALAPYNGKVTVKQAKVTVI